MSKNDKHTIIERRKSGFISRLRGNFFTGLVIVLPVALTIWMVWSFIGFVDDRVLPLVPESFSKFVDDRILSLVPDQYNPFTYVNFNIRGVGVAIFLVFTTFMGALTKGLFGRQLVRIGESIVDRVPVVRSIYNGVKQKSLYSIFVPTTPNPTSGFLLFLPQSDVVVLDMDVESAAKLIISAGLVEPPTKLEIAAGKAVRTAPK